jgi:hypothetical protein
MARAEAQTARAEAQMARAEAQTARAEAQAAIALALKPIVAVLPLTATLTPVSPVDLAVALGHDPQLNRFLQNTRSLTSAECLPVASALVVGNFNALMDQKENQKFRSDAARTGHMQTLVGDAWISHELSGGMQMIADASIKALEETIGPDSDRPEWIGATSPMARTGVRILSGVAKKRITETAELCRPSFQHRLDEIRRHSADVARDAPASWNDPWELRDNQYIALIRESKDVAQMASGRLRDSAARIAATGRIVAETARVAIGSPPCVRVGDGYVWSGGAWCARPADALLDECARRALECYARATAAHAAQAFRNEHLTSAQVLSAEDFAEYTRTDRAQVEAHVRREVAAIFAGESR